MPGAPAGRDWLSRTLRDLRVAAGLSGNRAAHAIGMAQSRISRIEHGRYLPTEEEIRALTRLYRAPVAVRQELLNARRALSAENTPARVVLARGGWRMQARIRAIEAKSALIENYQPAVIPGLLQTEDYMRLIFSQRQAMTAGRAVTADAVERSVAERAARAEALGQPERDVTIIMTEGALRWTAGGPAVMAEQLDHIAAVAAARPHLRIGVIPQAQSVAVFPLHGFSIYDRRTVVVGIWTGTSIITDPREVAEYAELFDALISLARFGNDAQAVIQQIAGDYHRLAGDNPPYLPRPAGPEPGACGLGR